MRFRALASTSITVLLTLAVGQWTGGAPHAGAIHGLKFEDVDADGVYTEGGDMLPAGVTFTLDGADIEDQPVSLNTTTDAFGELKCEDLAAGRNTVSETVPSGHVATTETPFFTALRQPLFSHSPWLCRWLAGPPRPRAVGCSRLAPERTECLCEPPRSS